MEPPSSEPNTDALQVATSTDALQVAWAFPPLLMRLLCINDGGEPSPTIQQQPQRRSSRPETPRVKGHRFSRERFEEEDGHRSPQSPRSKPTPGPTDSEFVAFVPPEGKAPHVFLIDPGSGEACDALQRQRSAHVHLAVDPDFDQPVKRYPPHWKTMAGVKLTEADAMADVEAHARMAASLPRVAWPSASDLRGPAHPRNLATWASRIWAGDGRLGAIDCTATGCTRGTARSSRAEVSWRRCVEFDCIVCGSRGGEVTLPSLWLLGCRLPAVVINAGCARDGAAWVWPAGVSVVLVTGGRDRICNEFLRKGAPASSDDEGAWSDAFDTDAAYTSRVWAAVPQANKPTTAILHLPKMVHRPDVDMLAAVLPSLLAYASSGLAPERAPTAAALGGVLPATLVTAEWPEGKVLIPRKA